MEEQTKDLQDYLLVIKKRKTGILIVALSLIFITVLVTILIPSKYQSSSTILIEQQEIPTDLAMSTVTTYAAQVIQTIQARVMSRSNLLKIINKYNLYADRRQYDTDDEIIARMQDDVGMNIINANVVDPRTGRPTTATIAFNVSYTSESPSTAQKVANELTSLYLNQNLKDRTQKASDTSAFFKQEADRLNKLVLSLSNKLAAFKEKNANALPEMQQLNQQILQRKQNDIQNIETQLSTLEERKFYLIGQLAQISPGDPNLPDAQMLLAKLEAEYASDLAKYSPDHPDVQRLKREIASLKGADPVDSADTVAKQLAKARSDLKASEEKYSPDYPDVVNLKKEVSSLEARLKKLQSEPETSYLKSNPTNPAYITLQSQLAGIKSQMKSLALQKNAISESIDKLESDMKKAPQVESAYNELTREYNDAVKQLQDNKAKLAAANVGKQLESESKGERFSLIDPPALPEEPVSPNRPAILILGFVFSLGSGLGFAFVADAISGAIHGAKSIYSTIGVVPLAVVPYVMNMADVHKRKKIQKRTVLLAIMIVIIGLLLINYLISPLDVLWFRILRKFQSITG